MRVNQIYLGDCLIESDKIESGSVDLILTDLPYGTMTNISQKAYKSPSDFKWDIAIDANSIFNIANRIIRKNGKMILFSQEPYTSKLINDAIPNIPFSYRMVWEKDSFGNVLMCNKAPVSYFEDILVFSKIWEFEGLHPLREYFGEVYKFIGKTKKAIIEQIGQRADHAFRFESTQFDLCTEETYNDLIKHYSINQMQGFVLFDKLKATDEQYKNEFSSTFNLWEGGKYKGNILKYKKEYSGFHPTQKPVLLLEDLIKTFSNEGNLVVDLTMGSGSTGVACVNTNRRFIGIEKDIKYFEIASKRINNHTEQQTIF